MPSTMSPALAGRFVLGPEVGRGAFGEVFRGRDVDTQRDVAIKRLRESIQDPLARERFELEARLLSTVNSPYVVRYLAHAVADEREPYLVLEWLDGEDMARRRRREPIQRAECIAIVREAALGLEALHRAGIVHRDVKPANFFLMKPGHDVRVKIFDLGVARSAIQSVSTLDGWRIGTPAYMSPEQARGDEHIDPRSDLFSLGVMLYELLAGRRPFDANDAFALLAKIVLTEPVPLRELVRDLPPALTDLVHRCLSKSPLDRPATAREVADTLASLDAASPAATVSTRERPTALLPPAREVPATEQRVVTALIASLPGTQTEVSAARARFETIAASHRGAAHRLLGRYAVVVFGLERYEGNEALRAARAALAARDGIPDCSLAVITCLVTATDKGVAGDAIDRGITQVQRPDVAIHVDPATARLLEPYFVIEGSDDSPRLASVRATESSAGPRILGRRTSTVGRERELGALGDWLDECIQTPRAIAAVVLGETGIGKSRLRHEFLRRARHRLPDATILMGRGDALATGAAFATAASVVRRWAGIHDGPVGASQHLRLRDALTAVVPAEDLERIAMFLGEMSGAPSGRTDDVALRSALRDRLLMHDAVTKAFEDWLLYATLQRPVILVLEDLQWSDRATVQLVAACVRTLARHRLFVMVVGRTDVEDMYADTWKLESRRRLVLAPLSQRASLDLVREVLGDATAPSLVQDLIDRADGNPFHLEELIRAASRGAVDSVPETVLGILQSRLDGIDAESRRVLRLASVFGRAFWVDGVAALAGGPAERASIAERIASLVAQDLVAPRDEVRFPGQTEYVFRHALVREVAYATLTSDVRTRAHLRAARWLQDNGERDPIVLGRHFDLGGDFASARPHFDTAAQRALDGHDMAGAVAHADHALALGASGVDRGRILAVKAEALRWRSELVPATDAAYEALALLPRGSVPWYRALAECATALGRLGKHEELAELVERWAAVDPPHELLDEAIASGARICAQLLGQGHLHEGERLIAKLERAAGDETLLDAPTVGRLAQIRALRAVYRGDLGTYLQMNLRALHAMERAGDIRSASLMRVNIGTGNNYLGRYEDAEPGLRRAMRDGERLGIRSVVTYSHHNLGHSLARMARLEEALEAEREAIRLAIAQGDRRIELISRAYLSEIFLLAGDVEQAITEAEQAFAVESVSPQVRVSALIALASARLAAGETAEALRLGREACTIIDQGGVEEGESAARLVVVEALDALGHREAAHDALRSATARLHARAATIADPGMRASFLSRVSENARTLDLHKAWLADETVRHTRLK